MPNDRKPTRFRDQRYPSPLGTQPLDMQVSYRFGVPLLYVSGELDSAAASKFREAIVQELGSKPEALLLEVSGLDYIDSAGLNVLFDVVRLVKGGAWLGLVAAQTHVARLAELTGLTEHKHFRLLADLTDVPRALSSYGAGETVAE